MSVGDKYRIVGDERYRAYGEQIDDLKGVYLVSEEEDEGNVYGRLFYLSNGLCADIIPGVGGRPRFSKKNVQLIEELKFGDRCVSWDDGRDREEHVFICKTPIGVMVADVDEFNEDIIHDMEGLMGGEYWFGFYKHAEPVEVREMTMAEIEKALGFSVKIVKEGK